MTRDEAVALLEDRLGNRGTTFDALIVTEMKAAQTRLEMLPQLPWFLLTHSTDLATVSGTKTVELPSSFLMEDEYSQLFLIDDDGNFRRVIKKTYDTLRGSGHFDSDSLPIFFALQKSTLYFFPTPSGGNTIDWFFFAQDTVLSSNVENEWLKYVPELLVAAAGLRVARYMRSAELIQLFTQDYKDALGEMLLQDEARRQASLDAYMGG